LVKSADGSLTLWIEHEPGPETTNSLPAPEGKFQLIFRTYQPAAAILNRAWKLPPLQRS
jgi:hypothetical protein